MIMLNNDCQVLKCHNGWEIFCFIITFIRQVYLFIFIVHTEQFSSKILDNRKKNRVIWKLLVHVIA